MATPTSRNFRASLEAVRSLEIPAAEEPSDGAKACQSRVVCTKEPLCPILPSVVELPENSRPEEALRDPKMETGYYRHTIAAAADLRRVALKRRRAREGVRVRRAVVANDRADVAKRDFPEKIKNRISYGESIEMQSEDRWLFVIFNGRTEELSILERPGRLLSIGVARRFFFSAFPEIQIITTREKGVIFKA